MITTNLVLIPYWVETALTRNSMSLNDFFNYEKLRSIQSVHDIAQLTTLQELEELRINGVIRSDALSPLFSRWKETSQGNQNSELASVIPNLSHSKDLKCEVLSRLSNQTDSFSPSNEDTPKYKIVDVGRETIAVVLYAGYIEYESNPNQFTDIIAKLLQSLYVYHSVTDVSATALYKYYVQSLERRFK